MHLFERNEIDHVLMTEEFTFYEVDPPWLFGGWSVGGPGGGRGSYGGMLRLRLVTGYLGLARVKWRTAGKV